MPRRSAFTASYSFGDAEVRKLSHVGAQAAHECSSGRGHGSRTREDETCRPVGRRDRQRHHAECAAREVADDHKPGHDRYSVPYSQPLVEVPLWRHVPLDPLERQSRRGGAKFCDV